MKIISFPNSCANNGRPILPLLEQGIQSCGDTVIQKMKPEYIECDAALMWSVSTLGGAAKGRQQIWDLFRSKNIPVIVIEVGLLKRDVYWKLGINGINRLATFPNKNKASDRWEQIGLQLKPWKNNGDYILICAQSKHDIFWPKISMEKWIEASIKQIREVTDRPILVRPHPRAPIKVNLNQFSNVSMQSPKHVKGTYDAFNFEDALKNCWAVVNFNSNPGVEAIIAGIPTFVSEQSLAFDVANSNLLNIEQPRTPDRTQWANNLAYCEWNNNELQSGEAWDLVRRLI